ncbi:hypothetical protein RJ55_06234 [Drechmeria coniospora]|nr:hypothetical protein RJ55_06234 [Drechmeria coniospora]
MLGRGALSKYVHSVLTGTYVSTLASTATRMLVLVLLPSFLYTTPTVPNWNCIQRSELACHFPLCSRRRLVLPFPRRPWTSRRSLPIMRFRLLLHRPPTLCPLRPPCPYALSASPPLHPPTPSPFVLPERSEDGPGVVGSRVPPPGRQREPIQPMTIPLAAARCVLGGSIPLVGHPAVVSAHLVMRYHVSHRHEAMNNMLTCAVYCSYGDNGKKPGAQPILLLSRFASISYPTSTNRSGSSSRRCHLIRTGSPPTIDLPTPLSSSSSSSYSSYSWKYPDEDRYNLADWARSGDAPNVFRSSEGPSVVLAEANVTDDPTISWAWPNAQTTVGIVRTEKEVSQPLTCTMPGLLLFVEMSLIPPPFPPLIATHRPTDSWVALPFLRLSLSMPPTSSRWQPVAVGGRHGIRENCMPRPSRKGLSSALAASQEPCLAPPFRGHAVLQTPTPALDHTYFAVLYRSHACGPEITPLVQPDQHCNGEILNVRHSARPIVPLWAAMDDGPITRHRVRRVLPAVPPRSAASATMIPVSRMTCRTYLSCTAPNTLLRRGQGAGPRRPTLQRAVLLTRLTVHALNSYSGRTLCQTDCPAPRRGGQANGAAGGRVARTPSHSPFTQRPPPRSCSACRPSASRTAYSVPPRTCTGSAVGAAAHASAPWCTPPDAADAFSFGSRRLVETCAAARDGTARTDDQKFFCCPATGLLLSS